MLTRLIYDFLFFIFSLFYLPLFILKGKSKGGLGSRLGHVEQAVVEKLKGKKVIWIHAVSVGEVALAIRVLSHWREIFSGVKFVLTTTTVTGYEVAAKSMNPQDVLLQFPVDFRFAVRRFVQAVHPDAVAFMETEIWPNLIWELSEKKIPLFILNGRISDKAISKYRRIRFFLKPILNRLTAIGAQDERMQDRFLELGAEPGKVQITGNLKFDWEPPQGESAEVLAVRQKLSQPGKFLCLGASTHEGEEAVLMDTYLQLREIFPHLTLFLAPRHLDRLTSIEGLAAAKGIRLKRVFSGAQNGYDEGGPEAWLLDRMGLLAYFYQAADAVFVGGSLVEVGGHNLVEPAYYAKPILFGPYMNNFFEMSRLFLNGKAAIGVKDAGDLKDRLVFLMQNQTQAREMGQRAQNLVSGHRGALIRNTQIFCQSTGDIWK